MKSFIRLMILLPFCFLSFVILFFLVSEEGLFSLKEIRIEGVKNLKESEIIREISPFLKEGFLSLDEGKIESILSLNPSIKAVAVKKLYPSLLLVSIEEKKPAALWVGEDGKINVLDEKGIPFRTIKKEDIRGLLLINAPTKEEAKAAFEKIKIWIEKGILKKEDVMEVSLKDGEMRVFYKEDLIEIYLGERDFETRLKEALSLYKDAREKGLILRYIDARYEKRGQR